MRSDDGVDAGSATVDAVSATTGPGWTGATGRPTTLLWARHGQTPLSVSRKYSGRGDAELTDLGREQAARTAARLAATGPAVVVTSPLARCHATAEATADRAGVDLVVEDGLVETDFGAWEGLGFAEAAARDPELHARWLADPAVAPPGGESFAVTRVRVEDALRRLVDSHAGRTVVVVSHVTPIKLAVRHALDGGHELLYRLHLDLASVSESRYHPDGPASVHLVNDTSHLR